MPKTREKTVNIRDVVSIAMKRKWLLILPLIIVTALSYGTTYLLSPKYESSAIIWIDTPSNVSRELVSILGREQLVRESGDERRRKLQAMQNELTSQTYLRQLIRKLELDQDPEITKEAAKMRDDNPTFSLDELKQNLIINQLRTQISVSSVGTNQIRLRVESGDPVRARDMVMSLTEILEQEKTKYEMEKILDNQSFADIQLEKIEFNYQQMIDSLTAAQSRITQLSLPENIASESNRREILSDIDNTKLEIDDLTDERQRLLDELKTLDLDRLRLKYDDTIVNVRSEIDELVIRYTKLMEKYAWNEQNVVNVNIRLNDNLRLLDVIIREAVNRQFASYPENQRDILRKYFSTVEQLDVFRSRRTKLEQSLAKIDRRINQIPRLMAEITELDRKVAESRKYRDAFRSEETTVSILQERAKERTKYKIIEAARVPLEPSWPVKSKILALGVMLGLILGAAAVFLVEMYDNSFKRVEDIEELLQLPVLATIPKIERLKSIRQ